jgi:hypothetical protein
VNGTSDDVAFLCENVHFFCPHQKDDVNVNVNVNVNVMMMMMMMMMISDVF